MDNLYPVDSGHMSSYDIFRAALTKVGVDFTVLADKGLLVYSSTGAGAFVFAFDSYGNFTETYPCQKGNKLTHLDRILSVFKEVGVEYEVAHQENEIILSIFDKSKNYFMLSFDLNGTYVG